tara:strand:+ start:1442 stop:1657 length:216 start_codon:yes stop_codon:yes gene_type:complete
MDKQLYRALLMLVNDKKSMELLKEYAEAKIALHHKQLEAAKDHHDILRIQGAIAELRRFKTLRDEVTKGAE